MDPGGSVLAWEPPGRISEEVDSFVTGEHEKSFQEHRSGSPTPANSYNYRPGSPSTAAANQYHNRRQGSPSAPTRPATIHNVSYPRGTSPALMSYADMPVQEFTHHFAETVWGEFEAINRKLDSISEKLSAGHGRGRTSHGARHTLVSESSAHKTNLEERLKRPPTAPLDEALAGPTDSLGFSSGAQHHPGLTTMLARAPTCADLQAAQALRQSARSTADDSIPVRPMSAPTYTDLEEAFSRTATQDPVAKVYEGHDWARRPGLLINPSNKELKEKELEQLAYLSRHQRQGKMQWLDEVWNFLEYPESSTGAHIFARITPFFILASVGVALAQSIDEEAAPLSGTSSAIIETIIDSLFLLEFLIRFIACPNKRVFFRSAFNMLDLMAAVPLFVRASAGFVIPLGKLDDPVHFYLVGVVPIIRLLKVLRRFEKLQLLFSAFAVALEALPVLLFTLMTLALVFSVLIYLAEPRSTMPHLPHTIWFTLVTMTTVGYGDVVPVTTAGSVVTSGLIIVTMLYLAVPLGIIGSAFDQTWNDRDRILLMQRTRDRLYQWGYTAKDIPILFKLADTDDDGELHLDDFQALLTRMQIGLSNDRILALFKTFDTDDSGAVDSREFVKALFPYSYHEIFKDEL